MSTSLVEGSLRFDFEDGWWCDKWDGAPASKYEIFPGKTPSCVDLLGTDASGAAYLIEVKDHSEHLRANDKPLLDVLRDKVHDTVMGVITAHRRGDSHVIERLARALVKKAPVYVVLCLEEPTRQVLATSQQRRTLNGTLLMREHERAFRWLNARLRVVNRHNCHTLIPGLSVHRV